MANTATRLSANGSLTITGSFDEVTYNPTSNVVVNLLNYTQDYSNAYWNNRLTISSTSDLAPDNSYSATIFTYNLQFALIQLNPSNYFQNTFGKTYTFSVYAKTTATYIALVTNSNFCNFNLDTGLADNPNFGTSKISKEANGFYRCSVTFTSTVSQNEIFAVWLGGFNGSAFPGKTVTLWGEQVELGTTLSPYQPRDATNILASNTASKLLNSSSNNSTLYIKSEFDEVTYNPNNIGPTRNLFPLSEDFTQQFVWTGSGTLTKNAGISPDGYNNAILYTGTGLYPRIQYFPEVTYGAGFGTPGKYYTHSIFVKYVSQQVCTLVTESWPGYGGNIQYDLFNGTTTGLNASITNATITKYPNNWWRITATYLVPSIPYFSWTPQWRLGYYNGTDYSGQQMLVWGAQMEEGNTATPYLATGYPKNLLTNTNFTTNEWYKENVTLSPNATIDPNGDYTGSLLSSTITGGTNTAFIQQYLYYFPQNTDFTYSVYLKPGTSPTTQLNFYNIAPFSELNTLITWPTITGNYPTLTNSGGATRLATTVTQAANGWWRFSISMNNGLASGLMWRVYTTTNSTTNVNGYSVYIWGPQLEFGLTPTTYIPNTGIFRNILPLANTNMVMKTAGTGNNYIKSTYDEVTGNLPVTDGLILYMDPMKLECYPESGNTAYDLS